ncbi:MAG: ABC transporter permease [Candidatus Sumerlaeia bacterium]|nr:ABC transporter permease [Candidatus Sumerlaeia bacterium]
MLRSLQPPSRQHWLGTDPQGRDTLARLLAGARISLAVGVVSMFINLIIGVGVGATAGWFHASGTRLGTWIDSLLMRMVDILYSIPLLLVVILMQLFVRPLLDDFVGGRANVPLLLSPDLVSIYIALGVTNWLTMARLTRGEVINQANADYVMAAMALGQSRLKILVRHVLPNCVGPLAVAATLAIPEAIFVESFLAFIGIGVSAPQASWGTMATDGLTYIARAPEQLIYPAIAISVAMLVFNLFGDGLRDALDPSAKH